MYLGRNPPVFTEIRVIGQSVDDDHLVMELGMSFLSADDMSATLAVKLRKRLGFGMWAKMHITGMHVEGKVLVGVKFLRQWPFLGRLRVCFVEPPYFQMTVKPIFNHGVDVTELPGIAGWLDKILAVAFEQTLVEPNMLVVDVEKFASSTTETWFSMDEKRPIAFVKVEIMEGSDMTPSDLNGFADPYVKGQLGPYRFRTKTQKKTLSPKWQEEFKIPICTWESPNVLLLEVHDKDHFVDDTLGDCSINVSDFKGGQRHDKWLPLQNIKTGRLHLAITVVDIDEKEGEHLNDKEVPNMNEKRNPTETEATQQEPPNHNPSSVQAPEMLDDFEPINIEGQQRTGIWVHHPGSEVSQSWEPRKRSGGRHPEIQIHREDIDSLCSPGSAATGSHHNCGSSSSSSSDDENPEGNRIHPISTIRKGLRKLGLVFHRSPKSPKSPKNMSPHNKEEVSPTERVNVQAVGEKGTSVKFVFDDNNQNADKESLSPERSEADGAGKRGMAKNILKQAHNLKQALSRKDSKKTKTVVPGSTTTEREAFQESDSIDEESPSSSKEFSPRVESIPISPALPLGSSKESTNAKEENVDGLVSLPSPRDVREPLVRKVSFRVADRTDGNNEESNVAIKGAAKTDGGKDSQWESMERDVSVSDAGRMNDDSNMHGQGEVKASTGHKANVSNLEEAK
ncbi:C2 domain-containing protein At1g53590-like isoform X2 [Magnolia sinica]|nr:C2 domain-containing protein At1g53590-like isoform X2 [Magnolia sinica]